MCGVRALVVFFFFKQKTAYEMRISDWSSDVCSSDLHAAARRIDTLVVADRRADHHHVIDDRRLRGCDDFASEQRLFAGRHLHFAVIAEALAELAGLGIDGDQAVVERAEERSEEHTSELQSLMRISYAVFCLKKKTSIQPNTTTHTTQPRKS